MSRCCYFLSHLNEAAPVGTLGAEGYKALLPLAVAESAVDEVARRDLRMTQQLPDGPPLGDPRRLPRSISSAAGSRSVGGLLGVGLAQLPLPVCGLRCSYRCPCNGSVTRMTVRPGSESIAMSPEWRSTMMRRDMSSPRPVPCRRPWLCRRARRLGPVPPRPCPGRCRRSR